MRLVDKEGAQDTDFNKGLRGLELARPKKVYRNGSLQFRY